MTKTIYLSIALALTITTAWAGAPDVPFVQEYHEAYPLGDTPEANDVKCVAVCTHGMVFAGTKTGLFRLEGKKWTACMSEEQAGPVYALDADDAGGLWVGAWNGLLHWDGKSITDKGNLNTPVSAVTDTPWGALCGGPKGLWRIGGFGAKDVPVNCAGSMSKILPLGMENLWVATWNGLWHYTEGNGKRFTEPDEIITAVAKDMLVAQDGNLWVAGLGGVTIFKDGKTDRFLTPKEGLPNIYCSSIAEAADGTMWIGTQLGVARYDGTSWSLRHDRRWLLDNEVRDIAIGPDGTGWIATKGGVSAIRNKEMTLAEKAEHYQKMLEERHTRPPGLVEWCRLPKEGDTSEWLPMDDDNDGQYTGMYLIMESCRYAVTKSPEAKARAKMAFDAMKYLQTVTETDGYVARTVVPPTWEHWSNPNKKISDRDWANEQVDNAREKRVEEQWHLSKDGKWWWKSDTSSDEMTGHFACYVYYYDLVADEEEKKVVRDHVCKIMDYIMEGDYAFRDLDGEPTTWGVWTPERLNNDPNWTAECGINSVEILSYLKTAHYMSGDEKYEKAYRTLLEEHNFAENVRTAKTYQLQWRTHIDDELLLLAYAALMLHEDDPELKALYRESIDRWWIGAQKDNSSYFNFGYASMTGEAPRLEEALFDLRDHPLDYITWKMDNSTREDITFQRAPEVEPLQTSRLLPPSERAAMRWDKNPWMAVDGGGGTGERAPTTWLLPYWMGRYYGYIDAPK